MAVSRNLSRLIVISSFILASQARAVNISNTWMLPEEGFPVFYRHFRDRVSWYEADAVCQFHHANLVTADSTSQYDAIRAYLKELDITTNVWIGLSKTSEKAKFTWSNYQTLSGMGHWHDSIPLGNNPLCVVMDPASDFLWRTMPCGGPEVATFICELPIPEWAAGPKGCLVTEVPSLTILYIPEQSAVELTSDCGLDGTKRIACKGDADREDILKQLTCTINQEDDFEDKSTKMSVPSTTQSEVNQEENTLSSKTTKPWIWTSNTIDVDYGIPTRHRRETEDTLSPVSTKSTTATDSMSQINKNTIIKKSTEAPQSSLTKLISTVSGFAPSYSTQHEESVLFASTITPQIRSEHPETIVEIIPTINSKNDVTSSTETTDESGVPSSSTDASEYPSAINQGQLFSIIENGTMFDFIELKEPGQEDTKNNESDKTVVSDYLYTTTPTEKITSTPLPELMIKNKKTPKEQKYNKKNQLSTKKLNIKMSQNNTPMQNISKEVEIFPIIHDSSVILNRTHRKEVPPMPEDYKSDVIGNNEDLTLANPISDILHKPKSLNLTLILTTMIDDNKKPGQEDHFQQVEITASVYKKPLPTNMSATTTDKSTTIVEDTLKTELNNAQHGPSKNINLVEHQTDVNDLDVDNSSHIYDYGDFSDNLTNNSLISEPGKVPNRQRHLTRPQRRQFYPYFFSRVLG